MLRITRSEGSDSTRTLKLEGKLVGPWIVELESAFDTPRINPDRVHLDLAGLTFVDEEGARSLQGLLRAGARVLACSRYVAEMLNLVGSCGPPSIDRAVRATGTRHPDRRTLPSPPPDGLGGPVDPGAIFP